MPVRISDDAATMANFETSDHRRGIDDDEVAIVLAQHRPPSASSDFATRVMNEIELRATMLPARPEPSPRIAFADDVMARLGDAPREHGKLWLRYLSHVGVAAAAVLFVLALSPFFRGETTSLTEAPVAESSNLDANDTPALAPALTGLKAKVREVFTRNGAQVATIDVGLVEGVRVGDRFEVQGAQSGVILEVKALSAWTSLIELPFGVELNSRQALESIEWTAEMRRAKRSLDVGEAPKGAFFGIGIVVEEREGHIFVREVLREIYSEKEMRVVVSRAEALGLRVGDRIDEVFGVEVRNESSFEAALSQRRVKERGLVMAVMRGDKAMTLREAIQPVR